MYRRDAPKIIVAMAVMAIFSFQSTRPIAAQTTYKVTTKKAATPGEWPPYKAPRTADGKPNLNGIWQALVTANIDVLDHDAQPGPSPQIMGEYGAWPGGQGIVEGGEIPYKPEALAKKKANADNRMVINITADEDRHATGDPELKRYRPGIPRANYMPFPFQIIHGAQTKSWSRTNYCTSSELFGEGHREGIFPRTLPPTVGWVGLTGTGRATHWWSTPPASFRGHGSTVRETTIATPCMWWNAIRWSAHITSCTRPPSRTPTFSRARGR